MRMPWRNLEGPAKLLAICAVIIFVGFGLCGLEWAVAGAMHGSGEKLFTALFVLGIFQLIAIVAASMVGCVALIVILIRAIAGQK
jgi:hypothetical protein